MDDRPTRWRDAIIGRMMAEAAQDVSDREIERTLEPCVCGPALIEAAKVLRADGRLTADDVLPQPKDLFSQLAAE